MAGSRLPALSDNWRAAALAHAREQYPREACGLLVVVRGRERFWPCRNTAEGADQFALDPLDYAAAEDAGDVVAVFHSHPNAQPTPSEADRVACEASGLPWHIVGVPCERWATVEPSGFRAPLVGRQFVHGVVDCYSLIRDYYADELRIELPDFDRPNDWWHRGGNLYAENFEKAGFIRVKGEPQRHDVILMQVLANVPNHGAIYLGNGIILHHVHGRLSSREIYGGYWLTKTWALLRHKNFAR